MAADHRAREKARIPSWEQRLPDPLRHELWHARQSLRRALRVLALRPGRRA